MNLRLLSAGAIAALALAAIIATPVLADDYTVTSSSNTVTNAPRPADPPSRPTVVSAVRG